MIRPFWPAIARLPGADSRSIASSETEANIRFDSIDAMVIELHSEDRWLNPLNCA
jgi:hypothetical protein